jgi:iron complex transport system substrate-binding protein
VRVVTLLPAATEIVAAVGGSGSLVGISHECDYPASVQHLPRITTTPINLAGSGRTIDAEVRRLRESGKPVIAMDREALQRLCPTLIITQGLCEVCAVSDGEVYRLASVIQPAPQVLSLRARDLAGIWDDITEVGVALDLAEEAEQLVLGLQSRLARIRGSRATDGARVLCVEWLDPLYLAGHWVPDLVTVAGGRDIGAEAGCHSARREWSDLSRLAPDHIVVMLCGFGVDRARAELELLADPDGLDLMQRVPTWIMDGNSYASRPGPRVVDGAARLQAAIQGRAVPGMERWRPAPAC